MIAAGELSSVELVEICLDRIERINPRLNALVGTFHESARAEAAEADRRIAAGERAPLLGVPVALKDELDHVQGLVTSNGSSAFRRPATSDAPHVARLRAAGAILLAKTTLPEMAIPGFTETETFGTTCNPWNPDRTPGGSSGGSAAAVAAGLVGAASGSDGAGSIRIPAANCGLFGLKPQRGRIELPAPGEHWLGMTVGGCLTRRVADAALWLDVAAGEPGSTAFRDAARSDPGGLRVAVSLKPPRSIAPAILDEEVAAGVHRVAGILGSLGHAVEERDPDWGSIGSDIGLRYLAGIEDDLKTVPDPELLEPRTVGFGRMARAVPGFLKRAALRREPAHAERVNGLFDEHDLLLMPTTGEPPVELHRWTGMGAMRTLTAMIRTYPYTAVWNYTGQPAAAVPAGFTEDGLPLSAQLVAAPGREDLLLSIAARIEAEAGLSELRPPLAS